MPDNNEQEILEEPVIKLVPAGYGKRIANYLIDVIVFSVLVSFLMLVLVPVYPLATKIMNKQPLDLADQLVISFVYGLYMSVLEALLKGKSLGKYITGTRVVAFTGQPIHPQTAFVRGLVRIIPFEQISAIAFAFEPLSLLPPYPWHDRWSGSIVIDEAKSVLPKK